MDTKDTGIRKQKPTAPGAEGNDGAFPKNNPAEGLTPSPSSKKPGTLTSATFTTITPSLKNFLEEQSTNIDNAVDDREDTMGQLEQTKTYPLMPSPCQ
ncbi:hypothetical protein Pmani_002168 [Petrolisthes manimaculis]|uniref:Uncharacterized protein n=1 Tax=Petrolisthes manimaculis TaxID=1843537 RepID=A0AAE1UNP9_9EUCA|nr:hypothetical protein Pmani_002168 [Petrolisthes manimaculis]